MTIDDSITPRDAARCLGIRLESIYSLIWAGKLEALKRDGRWAVSRSAVEARMATVKEQKQK